MSKQNGWVFHFCKGCVAVFKAFRFVAALAFILAPVIYYRDTGDSSKMIIGVIAGCLASAFMYLDRIIELKGLGFSAKLGRTIEKAEITLEMMRQLLKPVIISICHQLTYGHRMPAQGRELDKEIILRQIVDVTNDLKLGSDKEIASSIYRFEQYKAIDLLMMIEHDLDQERLMHATYVDDTVDPQKTVIKPIAEYDHYFLRRYSYDNCSQDGRLPSERNVRSIVQPYMPLPENIEKKIQEYGRFLKDFPDLLTED